VCEENEFDATTSIHAKRNFPVTNAFSAIEQSVSSCLACYTNKYHLSIALINISMFAASFLGIN